MSMLTPPGMGGQYRIKGDRYPRMRRKRNRRRVAFVALATVTVTALIGWGSYQIVGVFGEGEVTAQAADRPGSACRAQDDTKPSTDGKTGEKAADLPEPKKITVNVLNATSRSGLAAKTAKELKKRGFTVDEVANAPKELDHKVKGTALLISAPGAKSLDRSKVLGTHVDGTKTRHDDREDDTVDLVLGDTFDGLTAEKAATRALQALTSPTPEPSPSC